MKHRRPTRFGLVFLFTLTTFVVLLITIGIFGGIIYVLAEDGGLDSSAAKLFPIIVSAFASLAMGTLFANFVLRIPLRPFKRLVEGMRRLADGHFEERVDLGELAIFSELSDSFNTLATELQSTQMLRSDFVNNFSHEFKTPIVSIKGFAKILQRGDLPEEERAEYLDIIVDESTRLSNMATNVLNLTRVENQNILTNTESFNLSEQIRKCILMLEKKWCAKDLTINADFDEHIIDGNMELLNQVWINLLDNAVKFSPEGGSIDISICTAGEGICVEISNYGPAILSEQLRRIWDKFWQGDTSHASEGTGIGLSVVKKITELHHGRAEAESTENKTTFRVYLPAGMSGT